MLIRFVARHESDLVMWYTATQYCIYLIDILQGRLDQEYFNFVVTEGLYVNICKIIQDDVYKLSKCEVTWETKNCSWILEYVEKQKEAARNT